MSSEQSSMIALHPFLRVFTSAIVKSIKCKEFSSKEKGFIHADMVPKFSERVTNESMKKELKPVVVPIVLPSPRPKRDMSELIAPIGFNKKPMMKPSILSHPSQVQKPIQSRVSRSQVFQSKPIQRKIPIKQSHPKLLLSPPTPESRQLSPSSAPMGQGILEEYGKITPLLHDPSVSTIECDGVGKQIKIIRTGQKQITRIVLTKEEIKQILEKISEKVHIPLLEGVFRAAVDNFSINAVISEMIGSRFIIKKDSPYQLIEN